MSEAQQIIGVGPTLNAHDGSAGVSVLGLKTSLP